jgi:hypothetical protein
MYIEHKEIQALCENGELSFSQKIDILAHILEI